MNKSLIIDRNRKTYAMAIICVVAAGLVSRKFTWLSPAFLEKYPGDALWALMILLIFGFTCPKLPVTWVASLALFVSFVVEFSQLYQPLWLTTVRHTTIGHLVLGSGFNPMDLVAYAVGIGIGLIIELILYRW